MKKALMVDYYLCTGCHSCEVACRFEHHFADGQWGIKVAEETPFPLDEKRWEYKFIPAPSELCDGCEERVKQGKQPACVHNCQARCLFYGTLNEMTDLSESLERRSAVFAL